LELELEELEAGPGAGSGAGSGNLGFFVRELGWNREEVMFMLLLLHK